MCDNKRDKFGNFREVYLRRLGVELPDTHCALGDVTDAVSSLARICNEATVTDDPEEFLQALFDLSGEFEHIRTHCDEAIAELAPFLK